MTKCDACYGSIQNHSVDSLQKCLTALSIKNRKVSDLIENPPDLSFLW